MMDYQEIFALMDRFQKSGLTRMKVTEDNFSVELEKTPLAVAVPQPAGPAESAVAPAPQESLPTVNAPLVGTYFSAPAPDAAPYVKVGGRVAKGQTVGLIEAMKTMSEVPAPCDLIVEEVLAENGSLISFGAPILRYRHV